MEFQYRAIRSKQTSSEKWLVQFTARATEIDWWAGIPQKKKFAEHAETTGFQREVNKGRIQSLLEFYMDEENIIQNPLLCALRETASASVMFVPDDDSDANEDTQTGTLVVESPDFKSYSLADLIGLAKQMIERRVPNLVGREPSSDVLVALRRKAAEEGHFHEGDDSEEEDQEQQADGVDPSSVLFDESHILDFWEELAGRLTLLREIGPTSNLEEFLGFTKDAMISYLCPIVLVDGQHRLKGAIKAAYESITTESVRIDIQNRISEGQAADAVEQEMLRSKARLLPISLLMSSDPAEQVFQFVVVNQKATPVGSALLGTIVSTTLSRDEMDVVAGRLKKAGIKLEESQAITFLARHPDSPFSGLIERGLTGDAKDLLQWNVFASLIAIFRNLRGGKLFGERNDFADIWCKKYLDESTIVDDYNSKGFSDRYTYWSSLDGPWRRVFIVFWTRIRDLFANLDDPDKPNHWGRPRTSNLFNKISLTILAADFFQFLYETRQPIESAESIAALVDLWLEDVNKGYFDKDWRLTGVKKDSGGIRNQWASLWSSYRKGGGGSLPDRRLYRQPKGE